MADRALSKLVVRTADRFTTAQIRIYYPVTKNSDNLPALIKRDVYLHSRDFNICLSAFCVQISALCSVLHLGIIC